MEPEMYKGIDVFGSDEQVEKLWQFDELVGAPMQVVLKETEPIKWKMWPRRNQVGSSSCVYQARAKAAGILREQETGKYVEMTAAAYADRSNKPGEGSIPIEAFEDWRKRGIGLEALEKSQNLSEAEMNALKQGPFESSVAALSRIPAYLGMPAYDFDKMISTLVATGKPIPFGYFAGRNEWNNKSEIMTIKDNVNLNNAYARHEVVATPNVGIYKGEPGFTFEDSALPGIGGTGVLWMTRSFFEKRNYIPGLYATTFKLQPGIGEKPKPRIQFIRDMDLGTEGDDVTDLQSVYRYEGFFPANHPGSNYYGNITADCTKKFQVKYGIAKAGDPGYGRVGPKTRAKLNELYA